MREHRRSKRRDPEIPVQVIDSMTGEPIGQIGNLSPDGMMLIASREVRADALYQFNFPLPINRHAPIEIEVGMHEQWSEPASVPGQYWAGFRIVSISPEDQELLNEWVDGGVNL
ncbi:MAG: PilZ domain-containing protein [Xanthomonadales bacterium]|nr:PilZ domain-containing protein [Xanthomonadales bacterium]MBK7144507.1 PilZ domain-containing protein [Xanthomonadales bacterium]MCC6561146.1 PilZ domain-containing protein [Xanthomonadales bacterium]